MIIVGGGLVGSCLAVGLAQRKIPCEIYERRPDPKSGRVERGRSINLALSARGLYALSRIGIADKVLSQAIPMRGRMVHLLEGTPKLQPYGYSAEDAIHSVSRADLNRILLEEAERLGVRVHYEQRLTAVEGGELIFRNETSGKTSKVQYDYVVGSDGSASVLRKYLEDSKICRNTESYLSHGYKELVLPSVGGNFALEKNALHIWPRKSFMLIALPNPDKSFTCTLFLANEGAPSFETLTDKGAVEAFFRTHFPDFVKLTPDFADQFFANPTGRMVTIKCDRWGNENIALLGDAAHAIVPFFGQGMNCGFEDCVSFWESLDARVPWSHLASEITKNRRLNANAIADMAVENFVEMRDKVSDPAFLKKQEIERWLHQKFPEFYINRYQLVTFTRVPYSVAQEVGKIQDSILALIGDSHDEEKAASLIRSKLQSELTPYLSVIPDSLRR